MTEGKITVSMNARLLARLDNLVRGGRYTSRNQAIEHAVNEILEQEEADMLSRECAKLDPAYEQRFADEGLSWDASDWPGY